jgi:hypothetical protein
MLVAPGRRGLPPLLDALGVGTALFARDGSVLHENEALARMLAATAKRARILDELSRAARRFATSAVDAARGDTVLGGHLADCPAALSERAEPALELYAASDRYRLHCCAVPPDGSSGATAAAVVVSIERLPLLERVAGDVADIAPPNALGLRHGLTHRGELDVTPLR